MHRRNYLPSNVLEFQLMTHDIYVQATSNQTAWDISKAAISRLDQPIADFNAAVAVSENPETRTSAAISRRNLTRVKLEAVLRPFIQGQLIHNPNVTVDELKAMNLPTHDRHPTPRPDPEETPVVTVLTPSPGVVEFKFTSLTGRAKPFGVHGMEAALKVSDSPLQPLDWTELERSEFATHSPLRITFAGAERGKWLFAAFRWQNTRGVKGPWTTITAVIIP
ncbi:MAG: hypothetical protein LBJ23_10575 [Tannerella sp.]|jgi:hypothetical protein|nr:hypothetical protein [Tannerella sp.]